MVTSLRILLLMTIKPLLDELLDQVAQAAGKLPRENWIVGQGWNESDWPEHIMPRRDHLDATAPAHPVALWRCDPRYPASLARPVPTQGSDLARRGTG